MMPAKNETLLNNNWKRVLFVLFAFVMLYLISYLINPLSNFWSHYRALSWRDIFPEMSVCFFFCILISESSIYINQKFNSYLPWTEHPVWRAVIQTFAHSLNTLLLIALQFLICYTIFEDYREEFAAQSYPAIRQWIVISILISLMINTINTVGYLIEKWKSTAVEAAEHRHAAAEAEVQALKLQIDPHFVFNNLSVLAEMILADQQLGYDYAENFTKVYRYLLVNSRKELITLEEEIRFLSAYSFLIRNRIGQGISFDINIDPSLMGMQLPPLTMQVLIENALNNNKTLKSAPLKIRIFSTETSDLVFSNSLSPLLQVSVSSTEELDHIKERYQMQNYTLPSIHQDDASFSMRIPLIPNKTL